MSSSENTVLLGRHGKLVSDFVLLHDGPHDARPSRPPRGDLLDRQVADRTEEAFALARSWGSSQFRIGRSVSRMIDNGTRQGELPPLARRTNGLAPKAPEPGQ